MSTTFENFKGKIILHAQATAQEGQAEKLQELLKSIQADVLAGKEPGCLTYRSSRSGNEFLMFEEYINAEAVKAHNELPKFQAFVAEVKKGDLLVGGPRISFYEEV